MVELMKRRGGVGTDVSNIRGVGEFIDNAAASSCGVTPIMERYSNTTREVGQGGRRGALMLSIDVNHRDIRDFINYKTNLKKCTGANVSVRIDDRFMNSVIIGDEGANKTFDMLVDANRRSGEPGILFWSTILRESPFAGYKGWEEKSTNPCVTGDTLVAVADGRGYVSFEQLAEEGKDVDVYCADANGNLKVRKMRNIRVSGFKEKLVSVHLDNGAVIKCTPNHRFFLKEANMIKCAKDLLLDDSIHVMSKVFVDGKDSRVIINTNGERFFEHRFLYESLVGEIGDKQIHHIDGNPYNNSLSNFMLVTPKEHNILHQKFYQKETNPNYSGISNDELWSMAVEATKLNGCRMSKRQLAKKINFNWSKWRSEVYGGLSIFLEKVADFCFEDKRLVKGEMRSVRKYRDSIKTNWNGSKDYGENENSEFYNHKVVKVSFDGEEADVYTGTVDEFHNYFLGGWESKTSSGRKKVSSLLTLQCGEIPLTDGDSCRLFAINFYGFVENKFSKTARFYFSKFRNLRGNRILLGLWASGGRAQKQP
jgi:ribonucleotide reductase alpha subunit